MLWDWDAITINLITEIIGVIIGIFATYCIMDKLLQKQEKRKWEGVKNRVYSSLRKLPQLPGNFIMAYGVSNEALRRVTGNKHDRILIGITVEEASELWYEEVEPSINQRLSNFSKGNWNALKGMLKENHEFIESVLTLHIGHIDTNTQELLIDLSDEISSLIATISGIDYVSEIGGPRLHMRLSVVKPLLDHINKLYRLHKLIGSDKKKIFVPVRS